MIRPKSVRPIFTIHPVSVHGVTISTYNASFAPYLLVVNAEGKVIAETRNVKPNEKFPALKLRLSKGGSYRVIVSTLKPGKNGGFSLVVQ